MKPNHSKSCIVNISNKLNPVLYQYTAQSDVTIPRSCVAKDLGVHVDSTLKFDTHIEEIVNKTFRALGFVIRTSRCFADINAILHLYRVLVVPHWNTPPIWSPYFIKYSSTIESVQHRFTRFDYRKFHLAYIDYESRCKWLNLITLNRHRVLNDQLLLYNRSRQTT